MLYNEKLIEIKINQSEQIVTKNIYRKNFLFIENVINKIVGSY